MTALTSPSLREQLLALAEQADAPQIDALTTRPVFLLGAHSLLGQMFAQQIAAHTNGLVAMVNVGAAQPPLLDGVAPWRPDEFAAQAGRHRDAIALDFSQAPPERARVAALCLEAGVPRYDCVVAQAQLGLVAVYELASDYRRKTLERLDDFLALADRLADEHSRATLYANLLFRLSLDRSHLAPSAAPGADEYFSQAEAPTSFRLGQREHFCDCGAFQGPIVRKFLAATGHRYASITAFEPDRENFEVLERLATPPLPHLRLVNKAVSSRRQALRFMQTGTVSSYVSAQGQAVVHTTRLDDELDALSFLKMDVEGFEARTLQGAAGLIAAQRPRIAACVYHYAHDLLDVVAQLDRSAGDYHLRLRQHDASYYYDLVLYASPVAGTAPPASVA